MSNDDQQDSGPLNEEEELREASLREGRSALRDASPGRLSLEERERMRQILGVDPGGDVAIHTGPKAAAAAEALGAKAFTLGGPEVIFKEGAYQPHTEDGQALLAHELTHVLEDVSGFSRDRAPDDSERAASEGRAEQAEAVAREIGLVSTELSLTGSQKNELVDKVVRLLRKQERRSRERRGE